MSTIYPRRQIIKQGVSGLAGLSLLGLAGCNTANPITNLPSVAPTGGTLHMVFWGSATRDKLTRATFNEFHQQNPSYTITSQYYTFDVYFNKLDAMIAQGRAPDLIQMDMRYIAGYVRKRQLLDLTELIYNQTLDLSDFDPLLLSSSKVNNTVYSIPMGGNYQARFYNQDYLNKAGMTLPANMTWDAFTDYAAELTRAVGGNVYGSQDGSSDIATFELWIRQRGKEMYTRDGQVNFTQEDAGDWYNYWSKMRAAKACPPYSIQKNYDVAGSAQDSSMVAGKVVVSFNYSNLLDSFQQAVPQRKLGMTLPLSGGPGSSPGMYLKTSQSLGIYANTPYQEIAAKYANFIINNPDAIRTLGIERGIPGSAKAVNLLRPRLTAIQKVIADYVANVPSTGYSSVKTVLDPPGAGKVQDLLRSTYNDIASGKVTVSQGAQAFYTSAKKIAPTG